MQNKWMTYSFLGVMLVALLTLAVLQYNWLGSVSDAEQKRLEENLEASSKNFIADLNRSFNDLSNTFQLQVSENEKEIEKLISDSYTTWIKNSTHPDLVDSVYYVKSISSNNPEIYLFQSDPIRLKGLNSAYNVEKWISDLNEKNQSVSAKIRFMSFPELGDPTFLSIPIQLLDLVTLDNLGLGREMRVSLNVDQADEVVLLQLDDTILKEDVIPELLSTYFSDSYQDQYNVKIRKETEGKEELYLVSGSDDFEPDLKKPLDGYDVRSILFVQSDFKETIVEEPDQTFLMREKGINENLSLMVDSLKTKISGIEISRNGDVRIPNGIHGFSTGRSEVRDSQGTTIVTKSDTVFSTSFNNTVNRAGWEFMLGFKVGSLEQFVSKTKNRNLAISFGILSILGISVVMVVLFSQRSRDLANKQMLFVAGVSHELRTPLSVIRSAAENLSEGVVQSEERKKEYAQLMLKEGRRLSDMVDQIMEFSGIQSGKRIYQFTNVEVEHLVREVIDEAEPYLKEKNMSLELSVTSTLNHLYADKDALFLSINNLIQNAIKFSPDSGSILFKVEDLTLQHKSFIQFSIKDHGTGILEEEQQYIFEPFFRGKQSIENQVKGNGIGLSLVQKVAEAHEGTIKVKSNIGEGALFSLIIPVKKEEKNV